MKWFKKEEKSIFRELFGNSPESKVLELFLEWGLALMININDIKEETGLSEKKIKKVLNNLLKQNYIVSIENVSDCYKINKKNKSMKLLQIVFNEIIEDYKFD